MRSNVFLKYLLYILSLWLLFVSLFIMSYDKKFIIGFLSWIQKDGWGINLDKLNPRNFVFLFSLIFIFIGGLIYAYLAFSFNSGWSVNATVSDVSNESHEHLEFLTTYVMPLVFTDVNSKRTMLNLLIMVVVIGVIYVKTNRFYSNPSLAILGFRIYKAKIHDRGVKEYVIVCKGEMNKDSVIKYLKIDENTCLAKLN